MEKVGAFGIKIELFQEDGKFIPEFEGIDLNMPKEVLISQLKSFLKRLEDDYNENFKGTTATISGKPE